MSEIEIEELRAANSVLVKALREVQFHLRIGSSLRADGYLCDQIDSLLAKATVPARKD